LAGYSHGKTQRKLDKIDKKLDKMADQSLGNTTARSSSSSRGMPKAPPPPAPGQDSDPIAHMKFIKKQEKYNREHYDD
jgi:hypothetical protein